MRICKRCNQQLSETSFMSSTRSISSLCKQCIKDTFVCSDPNTYMNIIKELDIPFIKTIWEYTESSVNKKGFDSYRTLYIYNSRMKLLAFKNFGYKDSEQFRGL